MPYRVPGGFTLPPAGRVDLSEAKVGVGVHTKIVADDPHPALVRFAYSRHPPRKGQGYRIWLSISKRKALSHPARLIFRRRDARWG
jgi:hypothetical protein